MTRLWRLRKLHQSIDARLSETDDGRVQVQFLFNGEPAFRRICDTRQAALAEAAARRAELEREGWTFHW